LHAAACVAALLLAPACKSDPTVGPAKGDFKLTAPANGAIAVSSTPTFTWEDSFSVEIPTYTIQVSIDPGFSTLIINQPGLTTATFTPGTALNDGTVYYWQVLAVRSSGTVISTDAPWSFTTFSATPGPFTMIAPANTATSIPVTTSFSWNPSVGATSYTLQVTLATDPTFASPVINQTGLTMTSFTPATALNASQPYLWKVTAVSTFSTVATGAPWGFTTASSSPINSVTLTFPTDMSTGVTRTPTFTWTSTGSPAAYAIQVATDAGFTSLTINSGGITMPSFASPTTLASNQLYYWKVKSLDGSSNVLATYSTFTFTTGN
jgi:hypothetical protein